MMNASDVSHPERLHAMDATRAFALLVGVLFHAAWTFVSIPWGAPLADVSSNIGFDCFSFLAHTFRMPLFFLLAGFFARLLYHGRGFSGFVRNRFNRIVIPFVLGWLVLHPLVMLAWNWGSNTSGANLSEFMLPLQLKMIFGQGLMFVPPAHGGMFNLDNLWFLYYLIWIYALVLSLRHALLRVISDKVRLGARVDRAFAHMVSRPSSIACLSVATGLFLWPMQGWFGVDTPCDSLVPDVQVMFFFASFFAFGWLLHRQPVLLPEFSRQWKMFASAGLIISLLLFGAFYSLTERGVTGGPTGSDYPALWPTQIVDWPHFLLTLKAAHAADDQSELASFWDHVPEWDRRAILALPARISPSVQAGLCRNLSRLLALPDLFGKMPATERPYDIRLRNRQTLEKIFAGTIRPDPRTISWYQPVKLAYSIVYGLVMWLLVYGALGFFQAKFSGHNPLCRYIADSSYWIYLIHQPFILALQAWIQYWPWPGLAKFLLILAIFFAAAFASYHYLVRPTVIGQVLNGRRYPRKAKTM